MEKILFSINFGSAKTGLSTVGYILYNSNGSIKQARTTNGVSEIGSTAIYICEINIETGWNGIILWDTGEASPRYGQITFNYQTYSAGGYGLVVDNIWTKEEKEKLFQELNRLIKLFKNKLNENNKFIGNFNESLQQLSTNIETSKSNDKELIIKEMEEYFSPNIDNLQKNLKTLTEAITILIRHSKLAEIIKEVDKYESLIIG